MEKFDKSLKKAIEKSFPNIEKLFSEAMLSEFISTSVDDLEKFNFGLGTMIRLRTFAAQKCPLPQICTICGLPTKR